MYFYKNLCSPLQRYSFFAQNKGKCVKGRNSKKIFDHFLKKLEFFSPMWHCILNWSYAYRSIIWHKIKKYPMWGFFLKITKNGINETGRFFGTLKKSPWAHFLRWPSNRPKNVLGIHVSSHNSLLLKLDSYVLGAKN